MKNLEAVYSLDKVYKNNAVFIPTLLARVALSYTILVRSRVEPLPFDHCTILCLTSMGS